MIDVRVENGETKTKILEIAAEENVSAIVLGPHGRSNLATALNGGRAHAAPERK